MVQVSGPVPFWGQILYATLPTRFPVVLVGYLRRHRRHHRQALQTSTPDSDGYAQVCRPHFGLSVTVFENVLTTALNLLIHVSMAAPALPLKTRPIDADYAGAGL